MYYLDHRVPQLVASIKHKALSGRLTETRAKFHIRRLQKLVDQQIDFPNYLHRAPSSDQLHAYGDPDIELGSLVEAPDVRFGPRISGGVQHVFCSGCTGSGKTVMLRSLIAGVEAQSQQTGRRVSIIVFDFKGGDFSDFPDRFGPHWRLYNYHDGFHLGLDNPPGLPTGQWTKFLCEAFAARFGLQFGAITLHRLIDWTLPILNPEPADRQFYPGLLLLLDLMTGGPEKNFASKEHYAQSVIQAIFDLLNASGRVHDVFQGFDPITDIIRPRRSCVIQMHNVQHAARGFAIDLILAKAYRPLLHEQYKTSGVDTIFVLDECDPLVSHIASEAEWPDQMPPLTVLAKQGRESGIMLVLGASQLDGASPLLLANMPNLILLNQADAKSVAAAAKTLLLPRGAERLLTTLRPGQAVMRFSASGWPHATLGQIDEFPSRREAVTRAHDRTHCVPSRRLRDFPEMTAALGQHAAAYRASVAKQKRMGRPELSWQARQLLELRANHIAMPLAQLWPRFDALPSPTKQKAMRQELIDLELAEFQKLHIGKRPCFLMEITDMGWDLLERKSKSLPGQGSLDTRHFLYWVAASEVRKGYKAQIEATAPGTNHRVDVGSIRDGEFHAYEICAHCVPNIVGHAIKCLIDSRKVASFTTVSPNLDIQEKVAALINEELSLAPVAHRIRHELVQPYFEEFIQ
ncbi:MAG: type IV secretion system DNA-binding domain-containing protein [Phycisphaerales bacterium]|nr:type IV secretion system DNA-binding domain-containing protein [Phycisphaerales bacterium]MCB9856953.1 type IV secretion system DNA-binding domain-containing protein [Phycisphaerales bacterium]MCB9861920.1 type IV secretion system DNA-binding domain-containing protein [Phycisphaerales bacterium]